MNLSINLIVKMLQIRYNYYGEAYGKEKKSKESKSSPTYSVELTGLILILIGIIGMGFGIIGNFIKQFMMFLAGEFWFVILFGVLILGISMLFKENYQSFFPQD